MDTATQAISEFPTSREEYPTSGASVTTVTQTSQSDAREIAVLLRSMRTSRALDRKDLAKLSRVSVSQIGKMEVGDAENVRDTTISLLLDGLSQKRPLSTDERSRCAALFGSSVVPPQLAPAEVAACVGEPKSARPDTILPTTRELHASATLFEQWIATLPVQEAAAYRAAMRFIDRIGPEFGQQFLDAMVDPKAGMAGLGPVKLLDIINAVACKAARMQIAQGADLAFIERTGNAKDAKDLHLVLHVLKGSLRHAVLRTFVGDRSAARTEAGYCSEIEGPWADVNPDPHAPAGGDA